MQSRISRICLLNRKINTINYVRVFWNLQALLSEQVFDFEIHTGKSFGKRHPPSRWIQLLSVAFSALIALTVVLWFFLSFLFRKQIPTISLVLCLESKKSCLIRFSKLFLESKLLVSWRKLRLCSQFQFDMLIRIHELDVFIQDIRISMIWTALERATFLIILFNAKYLRVSIPSGFYIPCSLYLSMIDTKQVLSPLSFLLPSNTILHVQISSFELFVGQRLLFLLRYPRLIVTSLCCRKHNLVPLSASGFF